MKERGILFSAPMVRALLAGTKTQTRRVAKTGLYAIDAKIHGAETAARELAALVTKSPYGQTGDRLWVRETWVCDDYRVQAGPYLEVPGAREALFYRADSEQPFESPEGKFWKPSIHMPRWASRILLEIVAVRLERLNDCSEADARAEGAAGYEEGIDAPPPDEDAVWSYQASYRRLWESINGAGSWAANPWVWVVQFKRIAA